MFFERIEKAKGGERKKNTEGGRKRQKGIECCKLHILERKKNLNRSIVVVMRHYSTCKREEKDSNQLQRIRHGTSMITLPFLFDLFPESPPSIFLASDADAFRIFLEGC